MYQYIKSEKMKFKRSFISKFVIFAPLVPLLLTFILMGTYFQVLGLNWWYVMMQLGTIALLCSFVNEKDERNLEYKAIIAIAVNLKKIWTAKIIVVAYYNFLANLILIAGLLGGRFLFPDSVHYSFRTIILAVLLIFITTLWQIPLCLMLSNKIGFYIPVILNSIVGMLIGVICATKDYWFLIPFSWTSRIMTPILKILPNGVMAEADNSMMSYNSIPLGIVFSVVFFLLLLGGTSQLFSRRWNK